MHRTFDVLDRNVVRTAFDGHIGGDLRHSGRAVVQIQIDFAVDVGDGYVAMLAGDVDVAVPAEHAHVAVARGDHGCSFAGHGDLEVARDRVVACALGIGIHREFIAADRDLRLGTGVPFVSFFLPLRGDAFVNHDVNLVVGGDGQVYGAAVIHHAQAGARGKSVLHLVLIIIGVTKKWEITTVRIDLVA